MSTFRESPEICFWCHGPFRGGRSVPITHEKRTIHTCVECAMSAGYKMMTAGWERVGKVTAVYT